MVKCSRKWLSDLKLVDTWWVSSHHRISDFYTSSWQSGDSAVPLLIVRLIALIVSLGILSWACYEGCNVYWLIFLTNWGLLLVTSMFLFGLLISILAVAQSIPEEGELPWYVSVYWLLHNIAVSVSLLITALYWILLYSPEVKEMLGLRMFLLDLMTHGVNSVLVVLELMVSRTPIRLLHVYQPLGVGLWYGVFTWIYYVCGGTDGNGAPYIYEVLDWNYSKRCMVIIAISAVGLIAIYFFIYGVAFCRDKLTDHMFRTTAVDLPYVPPDTQQQDSMAMVYDLA